MQTQREKAIHARRKNFGLNSSGKISDKLTKSDLVDVIPPKNTMYPFGRTFSLTPNTGVRVIYEKGNMDTDLPNKIKEGFVVEKVKAPTSRSGSQHTPIAKFDSAKEAKEELVKQLKKAKRLE